MGKKEYLKILVSGILKRFFSRNLTSFGLLTGSSVLVYLSKGKVKCTLVQALRLCTGCTAHRGSKGIAVLFLDRSTRRG